MSMSNAATKASVPTNVDAVSANVSAVSANVGTVSIVVVGG